jgi:hypothetical protein
MARSAPCDVSPRLPSHASTLINFAPDFGLAGQDITLRCVLFGERIVDGHAHVTRYELDTARSACSRAAGVIDEDTGLVGRSS